MGEGAEDPLVGQVIQDRYRVLERLGHGGMGAVYRVRHLLLGSEFALKTLRRRLDDDDDLVERFRREAKAAAALGDAHIVAVSDFGYLPNGSPFLVMELLAGRNLGDEIKLTGPMPIARAIHIALQCCRALGLAHDKGIVHRDMKPDNVFLTQLGARSDFVKLMDFGISKFHESALEVSGTGLTDTGAAIGTPYYMSPEQILGEKTVDRRTDIYAMGVVVYQMLMADVPFSAPTLPALTLKILHEPPPRIASFRRDVPAALDAVVAKALSKSPDERYPSMDALAAALEPFESLMGEAEIVRTSEAFADTSTPMTAAGSRRASTARSGARGRTLPLLGAALAVAAIVAVWASVKAPSDPQQQREAVPVSVSPSSDPAPAPTSVAAPVDAPTAEPRPAAQPALDASAAAPPEPSAPEPAEAAPGPEPKSEKGHETRADKARRAGGSAKSARAGRRPVRIVNGRRASVQVELACAAETVERSVAAGASVTAMVPASPCHVTCSGVGTPKCPIELSPTQGELLVR